MHLLSLLQVSTASARTASSLLINSNCRNRPPQQLPQVEARLTKCTCPKPRALPRTCTTAEGLFDLARGHERDSVVVQAVLLELQQPAAVDREILPCTIKALLLQLIVEVLCRRRPPVCSLPGEGPPLPLRANLFQEGVDFASFFFRSSRFRFDQGPGPTI